MTKPSPPHSSLPPSTPSLTEHLARLPHFQGVEPALLARIATGCRIVEFERDEWLFRQGESPRAFFHVLEGGARLLRLKPDGREQIIHRVRPGQSFAEAAVMNMRVYPVHAVATATPTRLFEVGRQPFLRLFDTEPRFARAMVASLSSRLIHLVRRIDDLTVPDFAARLARYLLDLPPVDVAESTADKTASSTASKTTAAAPPAVTVVRLPMRKKDLAAFLGTTPETLSRQLRRWRDAGIATSTGDRIELHQLEPLLDLVAE